MPPPQGVWAQPGPARPASSERTLIILVLVLVILIALPAVAVFVFVGPLLQQVPTNNGPRAIGLFVARSSDGTNWTLTLTSVPSGLSTSVTRLTLISPGGQTALGPTAFAVLSYSADRVAYSQAQPSSTVGVGDRLLISAATYPTGYTYQISDGTSILASGALQ